MSSGSRERAFRRLVRKTDQRLGADSCHGCGRVLMTGDITWIGKGHNNWPITVANCCTGRLVTVLGIGLYISNDDRDRGHIDTAIRTVQLALAKPAGQA